MAVQDSETDIYKTDIALKRQLERIDDWKLTSKDKELVLDFFYTMELKGIGIVQRIKYVYGIKTFAAFFQKPLKSCKATHLKAWLSHLNSKYKQKTVSSRWYGLKKFYDYIKMGEMYKELGITFPMKGMKLPEELLTREEIAAMIQHCYQVRDKAIIGCLHESGCRIGEFLSRKIKHVVFDQYGAVIIVDGKTGMRRIRLVESVPLLANWIDSHPQKDDPNAHLWVSFQDRKSRMDYVTAEKVLIKTAARAGIKKKVYPHLFRHTRATELAKHLTEQQLKAFLGWTNSSSMAAIYVHLSGKDVDNAILGMYQQAPKIEQEKPEIVNCPRCTSQNHFSARFCNRCGAILRTTGASGPEAAQPSI